MRKMLVALVGLLSMISCGTTASSLYYWGGYSRGATLYEQLSYQHFDKQSPESICKLFVLYEQMISSPAGTRKVPPPGICAEYAYLLSQNDVVETFLGSATPSQLNVYNTSKWGNEAPQKAKLLFEMEMELYPESVYFIRPLYTKFSEAQQNE